MAYVHSDIGAGRRICGAMLGLLGCFLASHGLAQEEVIDSPVWAGAVNFGYLETSGNTVGETLSLAFDYGKDGPRWRHALHLDAYNQSSDDERKAEKYLGSWQSNLKFNAIQSMFFRAQYEEDKFSSYAATGIVSVGYGHRLLNNETMVLDLEAGPGYRRSKFAESGDIENEVVLRAAANFKWDISETASFGQLLSVEEGSENTVGRSTTSLTMAVYESLAVKLAYRLRWNRVVQPGTDSMDRETNISVAYQF